MPATIGDVGAREITDDTTHRTVLLRKQFGPSLFMARYLVDTSGISPEEHVVYVSLMARNIRTGHLVLQWVKPEVWNANVSTDNSGLLIEAYMAALADLDQFCPGNTGKHVCKN